MNVYIDCGAHIGKTVYEYLAVHNEVDICYAIEPCLNCLQDPMWRKTNNRFENIEIIEDAAWVYDGEIHFYMNPKKPCSQSATVLLNKCTGDLDYSIPVDVPCFDFSDWCLHHLSKTDYVFLKMDIEGAEYEVIKKMHKDGALKLIDKMYIELHGDKFDQTMPHEEVMAILDGYDIEIEVATH